MDRNRERPPQDEYDRPLQGQKDLPPLPLLPDREWLSGRIDKVSYEYAYFQGRIQYLTKKDTSEEILDENGQRIPRRQFNVEILLEGYSLPNGDPRKAWVKLGASMGKKANLPQFLRNMGMELEDGAEGPTPQEIIDFLGERNVRFQMATKQGDNGPYQVVIWDSVKPD